MARKQYSGEDYLKTLRYDDKTNWVYDVFEDVSDYVAMELADEAAVTARQFIIWMEGADPELKRLALAGNHTSRWIIFQGDRPAYQLQ